MNVNVEALTGKIKLDFLIEDHSGNKIYIELERIHSLSRLHEVLGKVVAVANGPAKITKLLVVLLLRSSDEFSNKTISRMIQALRTNTMQLEIVAHHINDSYLISSSCVRKLTRKILDRIKKRKLRLS